MRPLAPAALGLLLSLLLPPPPGEASSKPTPCMRCRELVDKFNQVGRALRDTEPGAAGPRTRTRSPRDGLGSPRHGPRGTSPGERNHYHMDPRRPRHRPGSPLRWPLGHPLR